LKVINILLPYKSNKTLSHLNIKMNTQKFINPFIIFFLVFPGGISQGFLTVALPYLLTHQGFSVAETAGIIAIGFSANLWRFLWGPIVDISLSLKKWYWISVFISIATLLLLCYASFGVKGVLLLSIIAFVSQVAATFTLLPVNGFMAHCIEDSKKGIASGWYQAGSLAGVGFGGGVGLWLTTHYSVIIAGLVLGAVSIVFAFSILLIKDIQSSGEKKIVQEIAGMGKDIFAMLKVPTTLFVIVLISFPIGSGAAANLWSAIAQEWKIDSDTVALVTGILSGLASALGCIVGGFIVDRWGVWMAYLGTGAICAFITLIIALMPLQPTVFICGVLVYTFGFGLISAAFTAVILFAIGKKNVATKFSLLASLGNFPVVYMTAFDGWAHDKYNSSYMLVGEAGIGFLSVLLLFWVLQKMQHKNLITTLA
jgi:MFS family permease